MFSKNNKYQPITADLMKHDGFRSQDPFSFAIAHRRLAWLLRISAAINIVLALAFTVSISAFSSLLPLKEVRFAFLKTDQADNRVYQIEPISKDMDGFQLFLEQKARRYVRLMLEIDSVTQGIRFQEAFAMTDNVFYKRFRRERIESNEITKAIKSGITRSITIESVDMIEINSPNYKFAVDFIQTDKRGGNLVERKYARAYLTMTTRPQEVKQNAEIENPLGIIVLDMILKEKRNTNVK